MSHISGGIARYSERRKGTCLAEPRRAKGSLKDVTGNMAGAELSGGIRQEDLSWTMLDDPLGG